MIKNIQIMNETARISFSQSKYPTLDLFSFQRKAKHYENEKSLFSRKPKEERTASIEFLQLFENLVGILGFENRVSHRDALLAIAFQFLLAQRLAFLICRVHEFARFRVVRRTTTHPCSRALSLRQTSCNLKLCLNAEERITFLLKV